MKFSHSAKRRRERITSVLVVALLESVWLVYVDILRSLRDLVAGRPSRTATNQIRPRGGASEPDVGVPYIEGS